MTEINKESYQPRNEIQDKPIERQMVSTKDLQAS